MVVLSVSPSFKLEFRWPGNRLIKTMKEKYTHQLILFDVGCLILGKNSRFRYAIFGKSYVKTKSTYVLQIAPIGSSNNALIQEQIILYRNINLGLIVFFDPSFVKHYCIWLEQSRHVYALQIMEASVRSLYSWSY